jgi:hypothetical protein
MHASPVDPALVSRSVQRVGSANADTSIVIHRAFRATREHLFGIWNTLGRTTDWYYLPGVRIELMMDRMEVESPARLVFTQVLHVDGTSVEPVITVDLMERNGLTVQRFQARFRTKAQRDAMRDAGLDDRWETCFHRLADRHTCIKP